MRPTPRVSRFSDWPERLALILESRAATPFQWGVQDCVTFAADVAQALTGVDLIARYRGTYDSEEGAAAIVGDIGLQAFLTVLMEENGAAECPLPFAQRGDWALVTLGNHLIAGVVVGDTVAAPGLRGLAHVPVSRAVAAWVI